MFAICFESVKNVNSTPSFHSTLPKTRLKEDALFSSVLFIGLF